MTPKVFETLFKIHARWTGAPAVAQAQAGMGRVARAAHGASVRIRGMTGSVFRGVAAYDLLRRGVAAAFNVVGQSITAAREAQEAHDELALSIERNADRYTELAGKPAVDAARILEANTKALIAQSEQMEKTGHDAETLQAGWARLTGSLALSPAQMSQHRKGFSDILSRLYGANATREDAIALGEQESALINTGNLALARRLRLADGQINKIRAINRQVRKGEITQEQGIKRRRDLLTDIEKTFAGETERVFSKPAGKVAQMWTQVGNLLENIGKPFVDRAPEMAESFREIAISVGPLSEKLAVLTNEYLAGIAAFFKEHKNAIPAWIDRVGDALYKTMWPLLQTYNLVKKVNDLFQKGLGEPARMGQLPGAPAQAPLPAGAGTQGEAARRNREAQEKAAERAAERETWRYEEGGPSAMPGKIGAPGASAILAAERARVAAQLQNPATRQLLMASTRAEVGSQGEQAQQAYMESVINRAAATPGASLTKMLRSSYYPWATRSKLGRGTTGEQAERYNAMIDRVLAGSNVSNLATGNESGNVRSGGARIMSAFGGERFVEELWLKGWTQRVRASLRNSTSALGAPRAGAPAQSISMSSPITVNGVAPGREYAVGRQVRNSIQQPIRELLDQIKAARNHEARLGYV